MLRLVLEDQTQVVLQRGTPVRIGRAPDNDVVLDRDGVSAHHAVVEHRGERAWIFDRGSKNGIRVNGVSVSDRGRALGVGDRIELGNAKLIIEGRRLSAPANDTVPGLPANLSVETTLDTGDVQAQSAHGRWIHDRHSTEYLLTLLLRAGAWSRQSDPELCLRSLLELALEALPARRGAIFLRGPTPVHFLDSATRSTTSFSVPRSILSAVLSDGRSVLIGDQSSALPSDSMISSGITTAVCVPMWSGAEIIGALYLDGARDQARLEKRDLELLTVLSTQAGLAFENRRLALEAAHNERYATLGMAVAETAHDLAAYFTRIRCAEFIVADWLGEQFPDGVPNDGWPMLTEALNATYKVLGDLQQTARKKKPAPVPMPIETTLRAAADIGRALAEARGIAIIADLSDPSRIAEYDPVWIERALVNLVRNAVEASREGGEVRLGAAIAGAVVKFTCKDRGPGIAAEHRARVLEPFYTAGKACGTGLGLAIANRIARAHGGRVSFTTELGAGTEFVLEVPVTAAEDLEEGGPP